MRRERYTAGFVSVRPDSAAPPTSNLARKGTKAMATTASTKKRTTKKQKKKTQSRSASGRATKMVYHFGQLKTEGNASQKELLGGKGANLAEMTAIGLPVPPGFTITTKACKAYLDAGGKMPGGLMDQVRKHVKLVEKETGKTFGDPDNPLLLSVRSGAKISMPGMMDTVLNLGLNDEVVAGLIDATDDDRFAWDAYRRLINMFGDVVMGVEHEHFEAEFDKIKAKYNATLDTEVPAEGLRELCDAYKKVYREHVKEDFPQDPYEQLERATEAVFKSWNVPRAVTYRRINEIKGLEGTAVNAQTMVFGNMGDDCGTGVAFTRNPSTGENKFYGEFLVNAQGEDVVAGIRTPRSCDEMTAWNKKAYQELLKIKKILEKHYKDMQDIEFTIERGTLYMLQTRTGKRTGAASVKIAVDMVKERLITKKQALLRIPPEDLTQLLLPSFTPDSKKNAEILTRGLPASPGAASGKLAFTADEAVERAQAGEKVLLVRTETSPEDVDGMHHAAGILTSTGGMTSHAAVVARGWGKCCVAGAGELSIDSKARTVSVNGYNFGPDDVLSLDGTTGEVIKGEVIGQPPKLSGDFATVMKWADEFRKLGVRTNADTPPDSKRARDFGAEGIGLTRTEHMFFDPARITRMREMIVAETQEAREAALAKLLPFQREDFVGIFTAMKGLPVTVRLLDPPLHEFLPNDPESQAELAKDLGVSVDKLKRRVAALHESNPMLGHRGCRLSITYPEICVMQTTAIVEAMIECKKNRIDARPEIMVPLIGTAEELRQLRELIVETIEKVKKEKQFRGKLNIPIGTMIEIPRAALTADEIAEVADFFSFGTNDLTQMTFGYSRDDVNTFLPDYLKANILDKDPFQCIDQSGVGMLVDMACRSGRKVNKHLHLGICGEHGGEPSSVRFCHKVGLDYVSCSPFRVPIARLVAAQAAIDDK
jgi:pyruvate,orthophosphate dikinase